ncbi:MAG: hypothetical protein KJT03_13455, partial [Verrucomicrobiae bacterium]|nr:hypothetical protein [Verrucomicrobiae bacterium]
MNLIAISQSIRNFHENPRLAQFSTTTTGRFAIWIAASMLIWPSQRVWWLSPLLALFLYRPTWRRELLCIGSLAFLFDLLGWRLERNHLFIQLPVVAFSLSLIYFTFRAGRSYKGLPVTLQKHPLLYLNLGIWPLILTAWILPMHVNESWRPSIVPFRWILPLLVWRLGYLLLAGKRGSMQGSSFRDHLWYCLPAVGGTNVPYGKGFDYLNANRADEPESIARTQLAGIKLLVLARLWEWMLLEMDALVYQQTEGILPGILPAIPVRLLHLGDLIAGADASIPVKWMSLFGELVYFTFSLAAM